MEQKQAYGKLSSDIFAVGDIVEWKKWSHSLEEWCSHYGVITDIRPKLLSNRLVYVSTVLPIEGGTKEKEFFAMSLKLVSKAVEDIKNVNC